MRGHGSPGVKQEMKRQRKMMMDINGRFWCQLFTLWLSRGVTTKWETALSGMCSGQLFSDGHEKTGLGAQELLHLR